MGRFFLILSGVAPVFLIHSLTHLKKRHITLKHPRIRVGLSLLLIFVVMGLILN